MGDLRPVARPRFGPQIVLLVVLAAVELAGFLALGTMRPDIGAALGRAAFWWKMAGLAVLALIGVAVALRSFRPESMPRQGLRRWALALAGILVAGTVIGVAGLGVDGLAARLMWRMGVECLTVMTVLSVPPVVVLGYMMRRGAPTDHQASAAAVGVAAAGWGAFIFAFHCPSDDPFYIVFWYALSCAAITVLARAILPLISRW
ncbi:NrsF family protein [Sphingomonas sp. PAMC 26605]|uniref:NrsF family protein n=1 Tax=Sphingomonas sp. PAMC 26605 TaxID=1112214 RepID=UPI0002F7EFB9|nr:NrsF family protein [Sphingomonas sp. PAMC 26605]